DSFKQIAGMSHVMLPDSTVTRQKNFNQYKYADTAIDILINKLLERQTVKQRLKAKLAGGAQMFQHHHSTDIMRIGPRNIETIKTHKNLNKYKYADTTIDILINTLLERQTVKQRLKAKLAGGAQMFQHHHSTDIMRIGPRNIEAVQERLKTHQIPITAKDVGG